MSMISLKNVSKFYRNKTTVSSGFTKINLDLDMGEFVVITGESGSGKSTLLNVISGLDSYEEGEMYINGEETSHYTEVDYENYRRKYIGNIFQHFNLINSYTVLQNVELALLLNGYKKKDVRQKVLDIIETVGLSKYKNTKASKLSGGQKQRVAIARALAKDTPIIVADEPTGNLDVKSAKSIMKLLSEISKTKLVVIVTHNYEQVCEYATRKIAMNDGHIIEDKKLKPYEKCEAEEVKYGDLTPSNKILLGIRNAFNIAPKFLLLFGVYFFLTMLVFSEYSSIQKQDFSNSLTGYNNIFWNASPNRVILKKKDKNPFSEEEIESLRKLESIESVYVKDVLLDAQGTINDNEYMFYMSGSYKDVKDLTKVDEGSLPEKEDEVVVAIAKDSYNMDFFQDGLSKKEFNLTDNMNGLPISKIKIVGIVYLENSYESGTIYLNESLMTKVANMFYYRINDISIEVGSLKIDSENYYSGELIKVGSGIKRGEVKITPNMNNYCSNYSCLAQKVKVRVKNIYTEKDVSLKVSATIDNNEQSNTIYMNEEDYKEILGKDDYQISVFLKNIRNSEETLEELSDKGYEYYYMKENLVNPTAQMMGIIKIVRNVMFIIATVALFFISYFVIKIILKSRNVYFSTIRILGATKKVSNSLLNMELFVDINVAYITFLGMILLSKIGIGWNFLRELVTYFTLRDYIIVYVILAVMSYLISNRYAHKLFKDSVMNTYREEV